MSERGNYGMRYECVRERDRDGDKELIHTADHGHAETRLLNVVVFHYFRFFLILTIFWNELECNEGLF